MDAINRLGNITNKKLVPAVARAIWWAMVENDVKADRLRAAWFCIEPYGEGYNWIKRRESMRDALIEWGMDYEDAEAMIAPKTGAVHDGLLESDTGRNDYRFTERMDGREREERERRRDMYRGIPEHSWPEISTARRDY
jgi:hypothetical protein